MKNSKITINLDSLKTRRDWKRHKVKDGHNVFRILPPFGENSNGYPYRKWQIIWGLSDPETGRMRPFASSLSFEKKCPIVEFVDKLKEKQESLRAQLAASGTSAEEAKERLSDLAKLITDLNPKTIYVYNAADKAGEVGLLELKTTAHKKMKIEMNNYVQVYNQDPTSLNSDDDDSGVWFDVTRQGLGRDTEYDVNKLQVKVKNAQGKISFEDDRSPLADSVIENYANLGFDLGSVYQIKTYDDLKEVLAANMTSIIEACPDADLGNSGTTLVVSKYTLATPTKISSNGGKAISTKFDDVDDEDEIIAPVRNAASTSRSNPSFVAKKASSLETDDFMAEADALLNG